MKLRKLVKIVAAIIAFIILALVAAPFFISAEYLKAQLVAQVKAATGRELSIEGKTSLTLFPNIAVSAEKVTLGNPAGFSAPYFMKFEKLETGAALRPLLAKELRITGVTLVGGVLNLEQNGPGAKNWEFASKAAPAADAAPADAKKEGGSPLKALAIGDIVLKDSAVHYQKPGAKPVALEQIDLTLSGADGSKALKLDGSALYQKQKVAFKLKAEKMKALVAGKASPVDLSVTVPAASVSFVGNASNDQVLAVEGKLSAMVDDLAALQSWVGGKPTPAGPVKKITLKTLLAMKGTEAIALNDLAVSADALSATGKLVLSLAGAVPSVRGALHVETLNLDQFSGGAKAAPAKSAAAGGEGVAGNGSGSGWSDARIDLSGLRAVNTALDVTINKLISGKVELSNIAANLGMTGGVMKLNLANASLYGGAAKGAVLVDGSGAAAGIGTNMTLTGIEIEPLMTALSGASRLEGKTNLRLILKGSGVSQRAIVSSLGGNAALEVKDGAFKGINIASFLRDAKKGFLGSSSSEKTDFSELTATFQIAQGIVTNNDLSLKSPILRVGGKGTVSLPPKTVNYRLEPTLVASLKGQGGKDKTGLTIPLVIAGPWSNPSITPDVAGMIEEGLKNPEALKENLQNLKGEIKNLNSPKDIGKALFGGKEAAPATNAAPAAAEASKPAAESAPAAEPSAKQKRNDAIIQGIGGLLGGQK